MIPYKQLSLNEVFENCEEKLENNKPKFLEMLGGAIDFDTLIAPSFYLHFHKGIGRSRKYPLEGFLWALLILFLKYSQELREFCSFLKVPDASKFTRFKEDFLPDLQFLFDHLVNLTKPICQALDTEKACMTIFDTSGIEAFVTENNPKYANRIIKQLKAFKKATKPDDSYDPYKAAYGAMPSHAATNPAIHADLLFVGIAQQITVLVADRIHAHRFIRSLKPLAA